MTDHRVLLLSHSQEPLCTERVASALCLLGVEPLRLDTDSFPQTLPLSCVIEKDGEPTLLYAGQRLSVRAVWLWRIWPPQLSPKLDPKHAGTMIRESVCTLQGLLDLLHDAEWIDPIDVNLAAGNKTRQLRLARQLGMAIPDTLITRDPDEVRHFYAAQKGRVIAKLQTQVTQGMHGKGGLPTRLLTAQDLTALESLRLCPMMFQAYIPKALELRIAWVDGQAFVGALDGKKCGVDWRYESTASWERHSLPAAIHSQLAQLMQRLGLRQGAIDMIVQPDGEYVFLEVNPHGEWGMLEQELGLPIGAALAAALTGNKRNP